MKIVSLLGVALASLGSVVAENNDIVVFVHGYGGSSEHYQYGPELEAAGLTSIAADVNPYASNHERACELWAQLTGTKTDYGVCYSKLNPFGRWGPDYTGKALLENFDEDHKIHLIGHSQGGLTVRYFERMLEQGYPCDSEESEFLAGSGRKWITSITTLATPNNGATIFDGDFGRRVGMELMKLNSLDDSVQMNFSRHNIVQKRSQSVAQFFDVIEESGLLSSENFAIYDMSTKGVEKFNTDGPTSFPDRYYFTVATERTNPKENCNFFGICDKVEVPDPKMNDFYHATSTMIGSTAAPVDRENDGIVSNNQARCPKKEKECFELPNDDVDSWVDPGKWYMIDLDFLDHMQLVYRDDANDATNFANSAKRIWLELGVRIKKLPSTSSVTLSEDEIVERSNRMQKAELFLAMMKEMNQEVESSAPEVNIGAVVSAFLFVAVGLVGSSVFGYKIYKARKTQKPTIAGNDEELKPTNEKMNHYTV